MADPTRTPPGALEAPADGDLTEAVVTARRGLRRDVEGLVRAVGAGHLLVPLARSIPGVELGEQVELGDDELSVSPHVLVDPDGLVHLPLFTRPAYVDETAQLLGWTTDDGPAQFCVLPGAVALELALEIVDEEQVVGLVINPMQESELQLRRDEIASLHRGKPIPLVGYVERIPPQQGERCLVAELDEPPPRELVEAVERCLAEFPEVEGYVIRQTFNAERDLEPHLTLNLLTSGAEADFSRIAARLGDEIEGKVPPPGYIDILFDDDGIR